MSPKNKQTKTMETGKIGKHPVNIDIIAQLSLNMGLELVYRYDAKVWMFMSYLKSIYWNLNAQTDGISR